MVTPGFAGSENKGPTRTLSEIAVPLLRREMERVAEDECCQEPAILEPVGQAERPMAGLRICGLSRATGF